MLDAAFSQMRKNGAELHVCSKGREFFDNFVGECEKHVRLIMMRSEGFFCG